ncbi:hypothetical protein K5P26_06660 [Sphingopyxis sp. XHP0097]|uniref:Uncharacterized protein n=1 Tax=Sphingopyxis jiangsuensis TaxID=2871171 RepID=A0ABS7MCS3_9SPHN|nr:hypothetical protein [Sphingopyxis jiangsuensis]MBY4636820.1 hypothetical protein [Sphingopyxis jiangsuensis]
MTERDVSIARELEKRSAETAAEISKSISTIGNTMTGGEFYPPPRPTDEEMKAEAKRTAEIVCANAQP